MRLFGVPLFLLAAAPLLADGAPGGAPLDVVLAPAAGVSGRVLDATGRPLAGATVRVAQLAVPDDSPCDLGPDSPCPRPWAWEFEPTPADGRFLFEHLEPGLYRLSAEAEGFLNSPERHLELAAGELQVPDLLLEPGAVLRGRALGADGRPLAGALVTAVGSGRSHLGSVESGADGRFTVAGFEPGRLEVHFGPQDLASVTQTVEVGPGENRADLVYAVPAVPRSTELRGRVVDAASRPVPGARVVRSHDRSSDVLAGADGSFALPAGDGLHELQAEAAGYAPARLERPIRVRGASVEGLELRLSPGVALRVRVPPTAGELEITWIEARQRWIQRHAEEDRGGGIAFDEQGWATIAGLGPGRWRLRAGGYSPTGMPGIAAEAEIEIAPGEREASVELAAHSVSGRVLDPDGAPLPYARLDVYHERQGFSERHGARADGGFVLALPSGTYRLAASAPGYASVAEPLRVEDAPVGGIDLRLGMPVPLAGRVIGLAAAELLEVEVVARQGDLAHHVPVDPEGEFELPALGPGPWEVSARVGPRVARTRVRLDEYGAAAPVEIAFPDRLLTLAGRVTGAAVPASLDVELRVPGEVDRLAPLPLDGEGRFRLAGLAPGSYELSVRDWVDDRLLHRGTFALTADRTITVPLREGAK